MSLKFVTTIDVLPAAVPLVAGYLQSDAALDQEIKESCEFEAYYCTSTIFQSASNSQARVSQISQILADKGLLGAASIPIQSMSDVALDKVGRSNIKKSTYKIHQENLDNYDINSDEGLLPPLPGETIESFRDELSDLYGSRADSLIIYPLLLINNRELNENEEKFGLVPAEDESNMAGEDQLIIGTNAVSLGNYEKGSSVAFVMVLLHNLRGLYCLANYLHHSSIRRYGDLLADFAKFLTASLSPSTARIAEFLTTVFQPLRYEMVQAYGRLVYFLCHEARTVVDACLREFAGGVTRIKHAQKQQPLSDKPYGSSWYWNYRSFRMITSRHLAATWEETHVAAAAA